MLVALSSLTSAQRLKKLLAEKGIRSEIVQTPKQHSDGGCSYSLKVADSHYKEVVALASGLYISVKKIYKEGM